MTSVGLAVGIAYISRLTLWLFVAVSLALSFVLVAILSIAAHFLFPPRLQLVGGRGVWSPLGRSGADRPD